MDVCGTMPSTKSYLTFILLTLCNHILKLAANQCVPLLNNKCTSYNATIFPNVLGHMDYLQAEKEFNQFLPLIDSSCSPSLLPFLCNAYFPGCDEQQSVLPPCATECLKSLSECSFLFSFYGFNWPSDLSCDQFADGKHCPQPDVSTCSRDVTKLTEKPCIEYTQRAATNASTYWFGTKYSSLCPKGDTTSFECTNTRAGATDSIASRLKLDLSGIDRTTNITYTYGEGSYTSCGSKIRVWNGNYIEVKPGDGVYKAYDVHLLPRIQWHSEKNELNTLIIYDAGNLFLHGIYVNIAKGLVSSGQALVPYLSPNTPQTEPNPVTFIVFKQLNEITVSESGKQVVQQATDLGTIINILGLTGPVALNWINVVRDPYAIEGLLNHRYANLCPYLETEVLLKHNRPFIPKDTKLDTFLSITFSPQDLTYDSCCTMYTQKSKTITLNTTATTYVNTADVRTEAAPVVTFSKAGLLSHSRITDTYTLICLDPDTSHSVTPILHWMVTNIPDGNIQNGQTVLPYMGPMPSSGKNHTYYFLLYKQESPIDGSTVHSYVGQQCLSRCLFEINRFVADHHLTLSGARWMNAHYDSYVRHLYVTLRGIEENNVCHRITGYYPHCNEVLSDKSYFRYMIPKKPAKFGRTTPEHPVLSDSHNLRGQ